MNVIVIIRTDNNRWVLLEGRTRPVLAIFCDLLLSRPWLDDDDVIDGDDDGASWDGVASYSLLQFCVLFSTSFFYFETRF